MINERLTDEGLEELISELECCGIYGRQVRALTELQEYRKAQPVALVEQSDFITTAQIVGEEPRTRAVRELFEGALIAGQKLYAVPQPLTTHERAELQEYRNADKPVYWQFKSVNGDWLGVGKSGAEQAIREGCEVRPLYAAPQPLTDPERAELESYRNAEFMPKNLDRALTIMGVSLPESKEEFNLQAERWMQRLIDRVIRCESELAMQSGAVKDGWVACSDRLPEVDGNYWGWWSESKRQGPVWFIKSELQAQFQSAEVTHWMPLPAAPLQEAK